MLCVCSAIYNMAGAFLNNLILQLNSAVNSVSERSVVWLHCAGQNLHKVAMIMQIHIWRLVRQLALPYISCATRARSPALHRK